MRLLDFGLAQMAGGRDADRARRRARARSPTSRPSGCAASRPTPAADVWAVGVMLWEALAGRHPFWAASLLETAQRIQAGARRSRRVRPDLPTPLLAARRPRARRSTRRARPTRGAARRRAARTRAAPRAPSARVGAAAPDAGTRRPLLQSARRAAPPAAAAAARRLDGLRRCPFFPGGWAARARRARGRARAACGRAPGSRSRSPSPVLPLGNVSLGLALALRGRRRRLARALLARRRAAGSLFVVGPLLAPLGALGLLPLAAQPVRGRARRAAQTAAAVLLAALVAGLRHVPLPFDGAAAAARRSASPAARSPSAVADALVHARSTRSRSSLVEAAVLAAAAVAAPATRAAAASGAPPASARAARGYGRSPRPAAALAPSAARCARRGASGSS